MKMKAEKDVYKRQELDSLPVVEKTAPAEEFSTVKEQTVENEDAFLRKLNAGCLLYTSFV